MEKDVQFYDKQSFILYFPKGNVYIENGYVVTGSDKTMKVGIHQMTPFNDTLLRAARGEKINHTPVWYMRQAGRSQPEYLKIKEKYSLEEITHQPELCAYVTKLPVDQYGVDAAILYKDIVTPLPGIGIDVKIKAGVGPVISNPVRTVQDVQNLDD